MGTPNEYDWLTKVQDLIEEYDFENNDITSEQLMDILYTARTENFWDALCYISSDYYIPPEAFAGALDLIYTKLYLQADEVIDLYEMSRCSVEYFLELNESVRKLYESLPETVTLYRGTCQEELDSGHFGLSWTPDRGTAEFFAFRFDDGSRIVLTAQIPKSEIKAVLTREEEVLVFNMDDYDVNVLTTEPTKSYDEYMERKGQNICFSN